MKVLILHWILTDFKNFAKLIGMEYHIFLIWIFFIAGEIEYSFHIWVFFYAML